MREFQYKVAVLARVQAPAQGRAPALQGLV
jgi:hypothetical protein